MRTGILPVHPQLAGPVNGIKMKQDILVPPFPGQLELSSVPEGVIGGKAAGYAGKGRLKGEWHQYLPLCARHCLSALRADGIVPQAVQVYIGVSDHLGPGILLMHFLRVNLLCPCGFNMFSGGSPVCSLLSAGRHQNSQDQY